MLAWSSSGEGLRRGRFAHTVEGVERPGGRDELTVVKLVFVGPDECRDGDPRRQRAVARLLLRPPASSSWTSIQALRSGVTASDAIREAHRFAAFADLPTPLVTAVLVVVDSRVRRPGWRQGRAAVAAGSALVVLVLAATFTGYLVPWDRMPRQRPSRIRRSDELGVGPRESVR